MDIFVNLFFGYFLILVAIFFGVLTYTYRKKELLYVGISAVVLSSFSIIYEFSYYITSILNGNIISLGFAVAWLLAIVFLILSQQKKTSGISEPVTQEYLDSIINAEDEEWDPES
jgi:hypothetical protein